MVDGTLFRLSEIGRSLTNATPRNAAPLFRVCPTGLVFGLWDSTGLRGGQGSKFARALVSEIVGIGASFGSRTESRIDPIGIARDSGVLFIRKRTSGDAPPEWTLDQKEAEMDGKEPLKWGSKKKGGKWTQGKGTPAEANHSSYPPTIDDVAGGVTIDHATHTVVLSIAALRRLRFGEGDAEARVVLSALGLLAVLAAEARGHDLRSRCLLVPRSGEALRLEVVQRDGIATPLTLDLAGAISIYTAAGDALPEPLRFASLPGEALATLKPSPNLAHLIRKSRELAAVGAVEEGE
jgi:CRISPR-associated protein Csb1